MSTKIASFLAFCLLLSVPAATQSLGELAKKERERREQNKDSGVVVREYSEEIFEEEEADEASEDDADAEADEADEAEADSAERPSRSPVPERIDVAITPDSSEALEEESRDRKQQEAEWRSRFHDARERVAFAREQKAVWDGVHYVEGISLVDENGNVVVDSLDDLRRYVDQANRELADAESALRRLEEEARRAGVPPGWLR